MATNMLYKYRMRIELYRSSSDRNLNTPMNRSNFKVNKGYDTVIEFVLRDTDRKPIKLIDKRVELIVFDVKTNVLILTKPGKIIDDQKGICSITFNPIDVANLEVKSYAYSVKLISGNGLKEVMYIDQNQNARGYFDLTGDSYPKSIPTIVIPCNIVQNNMNQSTTNVIPTSNLTPQTGWDGSQYNLLTPRWKSSAYSCESLSRNDIHTIAIYLNNFTGNVYIQGSLTDTVSEVDDDWFSIHPDGYSDCVNFNNASGIECYNFFCNIKWVRFFVQPKPVINTGGITQILLRN